MRAATTAATAAATTLADGLAPEQDLLPLTGIAVPTLATLLAVAVLVAGVVLVPRLMRRPGAGAARARVLQAATLVAVTASAGVAALAWVNSSLVIIASWQDLLG